MEHCKQIEPLNIFFIIFFPSLLYLLKFALVLQGNIYIYNIIFIF